MKLVVAFGGLVSLMACSSGSGTPPTNQDPGLGGPTVTSQCDVSDQNPYGVCYPTDDIGTGIRAGTNPGSHIANYKFTGYAAANADMPLTTGTPQTIKLADYYDPQGKLGSSGSGIKIIHLVVSAVWCGPCNEETDFVTGANYTGANTAGAAWAKELEPLGVVFVQALDDGAVVGVGATINDLNGWINHHQNDITTFVDPGNANLGPFFDAAAIPFNMNIDAQTMEILQAEVGFDTSGDQTIKTWVDWVTAHPANK